MRDINDIMPKIPNLICGAVTNKMPTKAEVLQMFKQLPHDKKWHTIFHTPDAVHIDGKTVMKKRWCSMT